MERSSKIKGQSLNWREAKGQVLGRTCHDGNPGKHMCSNGLTELVCFYYRSAVLSFTLDFALDILFLDVFVSFTSLLNI